MNRELVQEGLLLVLDRCAAAMEQVVDAYAAQRTRERDIHWVALQAAKEYAAAHLHARRLLGPTEPLASAELVAKSLHDAAEEIEHYSAYRELLDWLLDGRPCPVEEWQRYGNPGSYTWRFDGTFDDTRARWPWSHAYYTTRAEACRRSSAWGTAAILACGEGGAVGWHYMMSRLDPTDEFLRRVTAIEEAVVVDELYHGPETVARLAAETPSQREFEEAREHIKQVRALELFQRNEQFMHPLSEPEIRSIVRDFLEERIEPLNLFRQVHVQSLAKEAAKDRVMGHA